MPLKLSAPLVPAFNMSLVNLNLNGAVPASLSAMSFGPQSFASEANSFVILERETAEGTQPLPALPGASSNVGLADAPVSNYFGAPSLISNGLREVSHCHYCSYTF